MKTTYSMQCMQLVQVYTAKVLNEYSSINEGCVQTSGGITSITNIQDNKLL